MRSVGGIVVVGFLLVFAASGAAGNSAAFADRTGDAGAGLDVVAVTISNDDAGTISIRIETPNRGSLLVTDALNMYVDADRNPSTGDVGYDFRLRAYGGSGVGWDRWTGSGWADHPAGTTSFSGGLSSTINRSDLGGTSGFTFWIVTLSDGVLSDRAPDDGTWSYEVRIGPPPPPPPPPAPADSDGDGIDDTADACPGQPRGRFDSNTNGCPGPFARIGPLAPKSTADVSASSVRFVDLRITNLPAGGATVLVRFAGVTERIRARGREARSRLLVGRTVPAGSTVVLQATRAGWIGYWGKFVVRTTSPLLREQTRRCIPPTGRPAPVACGRVSRGR